MLGRNHVVKSETPVYVSGSGYRMLTPDVRKTFSDLMAEQMARKIDDQIMRSVMTATKVST